MSTNPVLLVSHITVRPEDRSIQIGFIAFPGTDVLLVAGKGGKYQNAVYSEGDINLITVLQETLREHEESWTRFTDMLIRRNYPDTPLVDVEIYHPSEIKVGDFIRVERYVFGQRVVVEDFVSANEWPDVIHGFAKDHNHRLLTDVTYFRGASVTKLDVG